MKTTPKPQSFYYNFLRLVIFGLIVYLFPVQVSAERLPIRIFTSADGLGSSFVDTMMRDSQGFLWFCTRDGLSRFDGTEFITYQVGIENSSPGIENIYETSNGTYWIVTTGGLYRFKSDILSNPNTVGANRPILNAEFVSPLRGRILEDKNGQIWLAADKVFRVKENSEGKVDFVEHSLNLPKISDQPVNIFRMKEADDGSLWLGTNLGIVRRLPDDRIVFYSSGQSLTDSGVDILIAKNGKIWLPLATRLFIINPTPIEEMKDFGAVTIVNLEQVPKVDLDSSILELPQKPNEVFEYTSDSFLNLLGGNSIFQSDNGGIWLTTQRELMLYDGDKITRFNSAQGFVNTGKMIEDSKGNLWIGGTNGLTRLDLNGLITYNEGDGLKSLYLRTIQQGSDGKIYTSQGNFLLGQFDGKRFQTVSLKLPPDSKPSWASRNIWQDKKGEWWILSNNGLYHFPAVSDFRQLENQSPLAIYTKKNGLKGNIAFQVFEDSGGNIWISTFSVKDEEKGLYLWSRQTQQLTTISNETGYPPNKSASSFAEDSDGTLWMGFYEGGAARFKDGKFTEYGESFGVPNGMISDLLFDRKGRLWIATTRGGLLRVGDPKAEAPQFSAITIADGLTSNNIRTITQDLEGNLFLGTVRGVDRFSPETGQIQHFSIADGLATDFVADSICDKDGTLWFATLNGLSKLVPNRNEKKEDSPARISKLKIAGETKPLAELGSEIVQNLDLAANENNLQIDFFGLNFNPAGKLRYQYLLEGADQNWSQPNERQTVSFANLQPGTYRFLVRTVNPDETISSKPAIVSFTIRPPFYRSWWFLTLAVLFVAGAVFALDRYRVHKTHQVEKALDETKRANVLIRESEIRFRTLADTASDAILTIDAESNIIFVNEAIEKVFGYTPQELIGKQMSILMPERMRDGHNSGMTRYLQTNQKNINWEGVSLPGLHKDGHEIPLEVSFGEFEREGKRYFTGIARDVSERKRAEEALQKAREEKIKELQRVRTRIATDLHDDIGSSLTQISLYSELARQKEQENGKAGEQLNVITNVANELVETMSDIVWAINPKKDHLQDLTQRMRRFAANILTAKDIDMEFQAPDSDHEIPLGANIRREVFLIFKETVNNIAKHSEATEAKIRFSMRNDFLIISFEDNGKGFDQTEKLNSNGPTDWKKFRGGNGLNNMRKRAQDLGGEYEIKSETGKGTIIILSVPLLQDEMIHKTFA
ncbi:MAG: PAS domain S-box protein [Pyrinomonadaceae bacterium]|nr:PAS domain S-box protein [Pyrinomonadaceae bacterium]